MKGKTKITDDCKGLRGHIARSNDNRQTKMLPQWCPWGKKGVRVDCP